MENERKLNGILPSPEDERDYLYGETVCNAVDNLPKSYMNSYHTIKDQKRTNFCSGFSTSSLLESIFFCKDGKTKSFSPLWLMKKSKEADGRPDVSGTYLKTLVEQCVKNGAVEESVYPMSADSNYDDNKFPAETTAVKENAKLHKMQKYARIRTTQNIKKAVVECGGCVWAIQPYDNYFSDYHGFVLPPEKGDTPIGGHAIFCIGYDDELVQWVNGRREEGFFILQESYGSNDGYKGLKYVPYRYIDENVTGLYTVDAFFKEAWCLYDDGQDLSGRNKDVKTKYPRKVIKLVINSKEITINDVKKNLEAPAKLINDTTMIPFRDISEMLNCSINYDNSTKKITAFNRIQNMLVTMYVGKSEVEISQAGEDRIVKLSVPPQIVNQKTYIPLRGIAEIFEAKVHYEPKGKQITITAMM